MELHLTASGTPDQIMATLTRDVTRERDANPGHSATLVGLRDDIAKQIGAGQPLAGAETPKTYTVSAKITITVDEQANAEDAERARLAQVGGQPFTPIPRETATGTAPAVGAGDPAAIRRRASDAAQARIDAANAGTTK